MKSMTKNTITKNGISSKMILFAAIALVGVLFMVLASGGSEEKKTELDIERLDPDEYAREIEERVKQLCNRIDGVSSAYVVVTLEGGYKALYATDLQSGANNQKNQTVIIGSGSNEQGLLIGYENPRISGIGIVCSGGDDINIRKEIISVVSSAFNLSSNKIFVVGS